MQLLKCRDIRLRHPARSHMTQSTCTPLIKRRVERWINRGVLRGWYRLAVVDWCESVAWRWLDLEGGRRPQINIIPGGGKPPDVVCWMQCCTLSNRMVAALHALDHKAQARGRSRRREEQEHFVTHFLEVVASSTAYVGGIWSRPAPPRGLLPTCPAPGASAMASFARSSVFSFCSSTCLVSRVATSLSSSPPMSVDDRPSAECSLALLISPTSWPPEPAAALIASSTGLSHRGVDIAVDRGDCERGVRCGVRWLRMCGVAVGETVILLPPPLSL